MPTVIVSHFVLDVPTLFVVTLFITIIGGLLLLFAFLENRNTPALALWGMPTWLVRPARPCSPGRWLLPIPGRFARPTPWCAPPMA
jgi:hypothetical protein